MNYSRPSPRERTLLYSIWALLTLCFLIFYFWPRGGTRNNIDIPVQLAPELQSWFQSGKILSGSVQGLHLRLKYQDKSLSPLSNVRSVQLGYDLGKFKDILFRGNVYWNPSEEMKRLSGNSEKHLDLILPNPQGTAPQWVRLYFADSR